MYIYVTRRFLLHFSVLLLSAGVMLCLLAGLVATVDGVFVLAL
ncbi:MAG TPA: hypothetical protein VLA19_12450 [Herpetosiphonaceae bacterium]|nr:hypothetical protein [Herpetosiphonaceae bacterium]